MNKKEYPLVTVIVVMLNEEKYIERCLNSILTQSYPEDCYEVVLVDGGSTDNTISIVARYLNEYFNKIRIYKNEKKILASGWNIGIINAQGEYVIRLDAHATMASDFLEKSVDLILRYPDVAAVGGIEKQVSDNLLGCLIAKVLSSPFGTGDAKYRYSDKSQYVDTVKHGLYRKSIYDEVGFFNESFVRNQDLEFHGRVREKGYRFYFDPTIRTTYYARDRVGRFCKQAYQNGLWVVLTLTRNRHYVSVRHLVPLVFLFSLLFFSAGGFLFRPSWLVLAGILILYFICALVVSMKITNKLYYVLKCIVLFFFLHISYGFGSLHCVVKMLVGCQKKVG